VSWEFLLLTRRRCEGGGFVDVDEVDKCEEFAFGGV
jgi:hypothetical protein